MLLGVEKKRKEEKEDLESRSASSTADFEDNHCESVSETCKDVTVVTLHIEYSTSPQMARSVNGNPKDHFFLTSQSSIRSQHDDSFECDSGVSSGAFEFQKSDRAAHRKASAPFSKPAPSKWDDAQKWIASPTSNRNGNGGAQARRTGPLGYGNRPKVVVEGGEEFDTKRIDQNLVKKVGWVNEAYPTVDSCAKTAVIIHCSASDSATVNRSQYDSSTIQSDTGYVTPPATVRSVSMRDMGTEMTPIASQDPSRTGTPVRATTPKWSPASSTPSSPGRTVPNSTPAELVDGLREDNNRELTEQELKLKTRREIMILGTRLGKTNIAAWASKGEEEKGFSATPRTAPVDPPDGAIEIHAAAWEEAEKAKYLARYKREEIKIQALENHQKAKAEAELRKTEVEVERTRANTHDRLVRKLTAARLKAEEKLAAAEAKRNRQAARAAKESDFIRTTGQVPSSFTCWSWCL